MSLEYEPTSEPLHISEPHTLDQQVEIGIMLLVFFAGLSIDAGPELILKYWRIMVAQSTLEATQGQILSQSPTDAISKRWHLYGS